MPRFDEGQGQDPDLQLVPMRDYARSRGWEIVEFVDYAPAGDLRNRRHWRALLAEASDIASTWYWSGSSTARSARPSLRCRRCAIWSTGASASRPSPSPSWTPRARPGGSSSTILAAVAEMERELISERVREGMSLARENGKKLGRHR